MVAAWEWCTRPRTLALVTLKFLPDEVAKNPQALARFQRYDIGEQDEKAFIAMEFMEGDISRELGCYEKLLSWECLQRIRVVDRVNPAHCRISLMREVTIGVRYSGC